jgi:hypothetical protein
LRLGQDAVLSGHEASPYSVAFLHNLVWKTPRANAYGRVSLGPARHSASVACSIIWSSFQPPVGGHGLVLESYGLDAQTRGPSGM